MIVTMMQVRIVWVCMTYGVMPMPMRMRLADRIVRAVLVLMMFVMDMSVLVIQRLVLVFMCVRFGQMQVKSQRH